MTDAVAQSANQKSVAAAWFDTDEIYARLKEQDPDWLAATLRSRLFEIYDYSPPEKPQAGNVLSSPDAPEHLPPHRLDTGGTTTSPLPAPAPAPPRCPPSELVKKRSHHGRDTGSHGLSNSALQPVCPHDLTLLDLAPGRKVSEHIQFVRSFDWGSTDLGPMSSWSNELRRMVNVCLTDPRPAVLWWGKRRVGLYNEHYLTIAGKKHPRAMGTPAAEAWSEVFDEFNKSFVKGDTTGEASEGKDAYYLIRRNGFQEEVFASWANIPIPAENGEIAYYNCIFETTKLVLTDRRMGTLLWLGQCTYAATDTRDFWTHTLKGLETNHADVPFVAVYAVNSPEGTQHQPRGDFSDDVSTATSSPSARSSSYDVSQWSLVGMLGLPANCPGLPSRIESDQAAEMISPSFSKAIKSGQVSLLRVSDGTFPQALQKYARSRATGEICEAAVLCPVGPTNRENVLGFMLIGINPRCAYDTEYGHFIQLLTRQVSSSMASMILIEDQLRRSRIAAELAAQDRIRLSEQLAESKKVARESETRFRRMADLAPVAMFHFDHMGNVLYANENWYELTQHPRDAFYPMSWYQVIHKDDHACMDEEWAKLGEGKPVSFELRLNKPFVAEETVDGEKIEGSTWIIAAAYAETGLDGAVNSISGCLTDISRQKWMEGLQERRMKEAMELKRQQENFMDMTSHEARNPLAAITLCAESIVTTFQELVAAGNDPVSLSRDTICTHLEGAEIIMSCAEHQKRIIDDVLTLSKLDSGLLTITPVEVRPAEVIEHALKMFENELQNAGVELQYIVEDSYRDKKVEWARLDPSRLRQVLINLLTNAIKFTQKQSTRQIKVSLSADDRRPPSKMGGVRFLDDGLLRNAPTVSSDEDQIYISVWVRDTGRGITEEEMTRLFQRFQQASPRTHVDYGGSGLGLFISRELTKLQGGQIGVKSEAGIGSTFAFYVQAAHCAPPRAGRRTSGLQETASTTGSRESNSAFEKVHKPQMHIMGDVAATRLEHVSNIPTSLQHILVVEDNLINQKVMSKQLSKAGYKVSVANHGMEALESVRQSCHCRDGGHALDIILLDIEMPVMDGLTCARELRAMEEKGEVTAHIPVVAVTANARGEHQAAALEAGMDSVVTKPFRMMELLPELEKLGTLSAESS